jgi:hypothetical protein
MSDIVERLRNWRSVHLARLHLRMEEAADEMERLRLTAEEREAVENCIYASERIGDDWSDKQAALLRGLLERLGPAANSTPIHRNDCGESRTGSDGETAGEEAAECTVQSEKCPQRDRLVRSLESRLEELRTASDQADAEYREEIARLRLTDADRAAIAWCVEMAATTATECDEELAALRGLLDRTK